jgi:hypothetical protein
LACMGIRHFLHSFAPMFEQSKRGQSLPIFLEI